LGKLIAPIYHKVLLFIYLWEINVKRHEAWGRFTITFAASERDLSTLSISYDRRLTKISG